MFFSTEIAAGTFGCGDQKFFRKGMRLTPGGREAGALRPGAAGQGESQKSFTVRVCAARVNALFCSSALVSCVLCVCLIVLRVRASTWAEGGEGREGSELARTEGCVRSLRRLCRIASEKRGHHWQSSRKPPGILVIGRAACRRPLEEKTSSLRALGNHRFLK